MLAAPFPARSRTDSPNGTVALVKTGSGTQYLSGSNTYTGGTTVNAGVLAAGAGNAPSALSNVYVTGGTLDATNSPQSIYSLSVGAAGALNLAIGNLLTSNVLSTDSFGGTLNLFGNAAAGVELISYGGYTGGFTTVDLNGNPLPTNQLVYGANALNLLAQSTGPATWATGSGNWSVGPWSTPSAPNGRGQAAVLNNAASPLVSVVLDEPVTVGTLALGNTDGSTNSGFSISATGANALTLDNSGSTSHITVQGGTHVISAPIWLAGKSECRADGQFDAHLKRRHQRKHGRFGLELGRRRHADPQRLQRLHRRHLREGRHARGREPQRHSQRVRA